MKPDFQLVLGDFTFVNTEVPQSIKVGGSQVLAVHQLIGGKRIIDTLGPKPEPLSWSGWLVGEKAFERFLYLDALRAQGKELDFFFGQLTYRVVIASFTADFQRQYQLPYQITLEVVEANNLKNGLPAYPSVNDVLDEDMNTADQLGNTIGNSEITGLLGTVRAGISAVSDFAKATQAELAAVLEPIRQTREVIKDAITVANNTIMSVVTVGGIIPNSPASEQATRLLDQVNAFNSNTNLVRLDTVLGRMNTNVLNANSGTKSITTAGGNLMDIAARAYGDAMAWTGIARANNMTDPAIVGAKTIAIPTKPDTSGGVLNV